MTMRWMWIPVLLFLGAQTTRQVNTPEGTGSDAAVACEQWGRAEFAGGAVYLVDPGHSGARDDGAGTPGQPWRTLAAASRRDLKPGDVVLFRGGLYRGALRPRAAGLVLAGCPGEGVVISGAEPLETTWKAAGVAWEAESYRPQEDFGDRYDPNLIVADGRPLRPALPETALEPGTFRVLEDGWGGRTLRIRLPGDRNPRESALEVGTRAVLFDPESGTPCRDQSPARAGHMLVNLAFRHAANPAQTGAVCLSGSGGLVRDVTIHQTNGRGLEIWGSRHEIQGLDASSNGHLGLGGGCEDCRLTDVTADFNNWRGHDPFWEAGGGKWVRTHRTVFRNFQARSNDGPGLWFDGESTRNIVEGARLLDNLVSGLQVELGSDDNRIVDSWMMGTRRDGWAAEGILIMAASGTVLERNLIQDNLGSGLWLRVDSRRPTGGIQARDNVFVDNASSSDGKDYQVRIERDAMEGQTPPVIVWSGNRLVTPRARHVAGVRLWREEPVVPVDESERLDALLGASGPTWVVKDSRAWRGSWIPPVERIPNP